MGLDMGAVKLSAFKADNMFDDRYYLRRPRFLVYQLAIIITVVAEGLSTYCLNKYSKFDTEVEHYQPGASYHSTDIIAVAAVTLASASFVSTLYGTMFYSLLFWPELPETQKWSRIKFFASMYANMAVLASCIASTVVVAKNHAYWTPSPTGSLADLDAHFANPTPPLYYKDNGYAVGWVVLLWIGFLFTVLSSFYAIKASKFHLANPHIVGTYIRNDARGSEEPKPNVV